MLGEQCEALCPAKGNLLAQLREFSRNSWNFWRAPQRQLRRSSFFYHTECSPARLITVSTGLAWRVISSLKRCFRCSTDNVDMRDTFPGDARGWWRPRRQMVMFGTEEKSDWWVAGGGLGPPPFEVCGEVGAEKIDSDQRVLSRWTRVQDHLTVVVDLLIWWLGGGKCGQHIVNWCLIGGSGQGDVEWVVSRIDRRFWFIVLHHPEKFYNSFAPKRRAQQSKTKLENHPKYCSIFSFWWKWDSKRIFLDLFKTINE